MTWLFIMYKKLNTKIISFNVEKRLGTRFITLFLIWLIRVHLINFVKWAYSLFFIHKIRRSGFVGNNFMVYSFSGELLQNCDAQPSIFIVIILYWAKITNTTLNKRTYMDVHIRVSERVKWLMMEVTSWLRSLYI